jgi:hypothetical protein
MNERIKELANQSGVVYDWDPGTDGPEVYFERQEDFERFTELIVAECVKAVKPDTEYPMESVDIVEEFHRGYWVGCNDSTMRIKEHFGVEE